jgi:hypothetical protein
MARHLLHRVSNPTGKNKCYVGIKCLVGDTKQDVVDYILTHFYEDIKKLIALGEVPSIDRIRSSDHYEHGNIRVITWAENSRLGAQRGSSESSKPVKVTEPSGKITVYESVSKVSRTYGIKRDTVIRGAKTGKPSRNGFIFAYMQ